VTEQFEQQSDPQFLANVRAATVDPGDLAMWYTGGAGYVIRSVGATLLFDPFVGPSSPPDWVRVIPPAFDPERIADLGEIDAIVITHEHGDHADPDALGPLGRLTTAQVIGPAACIEVARKAGVPEARLKVLAHDETITIGDVTLTAVEAHDPGAPGCNGYVMETGKVTMLHAGDSLYFPGFFEFGKRWAFDAICVSVGSNPPGQTFYLDESDAARAARDSGTRTLVLHHYDLWQGLTLDPERVAFATSWYAPDTTTIAAKFQERITITPTL
jgi:L-ascorbate 6-phosphate lactonase